MMDWGMALSVGLAVALISELTILGAIILPKFPLEGGRTWRGTVTAVSGVSLVIGGAGGYIAGQFGGRGGGGATTAGQVAVSTQPAAAIPVASQVSPIVPTKPARPETYLANQVDLLFMLDINTKLVANHTCKLVTYCRKGSGWDEVTHDVIATGLEDFLKKVNVSLDGYQKEIMPEDQPARRLRIFMQPFPGEGVYDRLRQQAEAKGWKVDRRDVVWRPEAPNS